MKYTHVFFLICLGLTTLTKGVAQENKNGRKELHLRDKVSRVVIVSLEPKLLKTGYDDSSEQAYDSTMNSYKTTPLDKIPMDTTEVDVYGFSVAGFYIAMNTYFNGNSNTSYIKLAHDSIAVQRIDSDLDFHSIEITNYTDKGAPTYSVLSDYGTGKVISETRFKSDARGNVLETDDSLKSGKWQITKKRTYNALNKPVEEIDYEQGKISQHSVTAYNQIGEVLSISYLDSEGELFEKSVWSYLPDGAYECVYYGEPGDTVSEKRLFDKYDNIREQLFYKKGQVTDSIKCEFDANGNSIKEYHTQAGHKTITREMEYDSHNNWIKMVTKTDRIVQSVQIRQIEYYK